MSIKPKIFIASSTEARPIASQIADALSKAGFIPIPWWAAFTLGDITLQALKLQAEQCDGAVFVFAEDDQAVIRDRKTAITRDNVVFEYGLFMAKLGPSKAVAILQAKTNNPTDFIGVTHDIFESSFINVDRLVAHFRAALLAPAPATTHNETPIFQDDELSRSLFSNDRFPPHWRQRLLYIGVDGAKGWMNVCQSTQYSNSTVGHQARRAVVDAAHNMGEVNTFISFGPGDGLLDEELIVSITKRDTRVSYIPIDINIDFVKQAVMRMPDSVNVPFGLVADFEDRMSFIASKLNKFSASNRAFSMLGYTLSNLDRNEARFMKRIRDLMHPTDWCLIDVSTASSKWTPEQDNAMRPSTFSQEYRWFFGLGLLRRCGESPDVFVNEFDKRISCEATDVSDVPGARVLILRDQKTGLELFKFTRYDYDKFKNWLEKDMGLRVSFDKETYRNGIADFGVVLCRTV